MSAVIDFTGAFISTLSLVILSYYVIRNQISPGALLSTMSLMPALGDAVSNFVSERVFYQSGEQLFEEKFKDVERIYEAEICKPFFFKDLNIEMKMKQEESGKNYAIIGTSGSGKSTLLKLIVGEIQTYDGDVIIDGEVKDKSKQLFDSIAYVGQQTFLLNDTLLNNITLGKDVSIEQVKDMLLNMSLT